MTPFNNTMETKLHANVPCGDHNACTACGACLAMCPLNCIEMLPDGEGFLYPKTHLDNCNSCGLCQQVCPINTGGDIAKNSNDIREPLAIYAAWNLDETIRFSSSSGGIFTALAESVIDQGGIVIGAAFDEYLVVRHMIVQTKEGIECLRGSKYVQSEMGPDIFKEAKDALLNNRRVLFSGTPCQVAGLREYLTEPHDNLLCCDFVCHGVPSPSFLKKYIASVHQRGNKIKKVNFRHKANGWKRFGLRMTFEKGKSRYNDFQSDPYMIGFLRNYSLRESCYRCKYATLDRMGDLTLADFWGIAKKYPEYDREDKGTSLVLVNTQKGGIGLDCIRANLFIEPADRNTAIAGNPCLFRSAARPSERDTFYGDLSRVTISKLRKKYRLYRPSLWRRAIGFLNRRLKKGSAQ